MKATVYITLKEGVVDSQGNAVQGALHSLGFTEAGQVKVGKYIELELNTTDENEAKRQVKAMCEQLLANTVIEDYRFELHPALQQEGIQ